MLQQESRLRIADNSGGRRAKLIRLSKISSTIRSLEALVRITHVYPSKKLKKGQVHLACLIGFRFPQNRKTGLTVKSYNNDILILKKDKTPFASRVYRPIFLELRYFGLSRICSIARSIY